MHDNIKDWVSSLVSRGSLSGRLFSFFALFVALCPMLTAVFCALPSFFGGWDFIWEGHTYGYYFLPDVKHHLPVGIVLAVMWAMVFASFCRIQLRLEARNLPAKVFLLTLISRGILALSIGQLITHVGDFAYAWDRACSGCVDPAATSHLLAPTWMVFSMFERFWVLAFGPNIGVGLLAGAIFDAITAAMAFYFVNYMFCRRDIAFVAASLYAFYPSAIIHTLTGTPEHMGVACFMTMAALLAKCIAEPMTVRRQIGLVCASGVIAGLGNSVKPIFFIYATATFICFVVVLLSGGNGFLRRMSLSIGVVCIFLVIEMSTYTVAISGAERMFGVAFRDVDPLPHCLCVGLNRPGEGQIHVGGLSRTWHRLIASGEQPDVASHKTYEIVINDWKSHLDEIGSFFAKKIVWTWQDDNRPFGWAILQMAKVADKVLDGSDRDLMAKAVIDRQLHIDPEWKAQEIAKPSAKAQLMDYLWQSVQTAGFIWYFVIMLLASIGALKQRKWARTNILYVWTCLFVLGFWGLMVISESASRYKCLVMPYVFIVMAPLVTDIVLKRAGRDIPKNSGR